MTSTTNTNIWIVTGGAGFIGSNLIKRLLNLPETELVVCIDDFSTGKKENLPVDEKLIVKEESISTIQTFLDTIPKGSKSLVRVVHLAAIASVPLSLKNPLKSYKVNVEGTRRMYLLSQLTQFSGYRPVESFVFASSSAVYGDENRILKSPYAHHKIENESLLLQSDRMFSAVGLRFFNVYGPNQDPKNAYAAVITKWIDSMESGNDVYINGDGSTSRDFVHVDDVVTTIIKSSLNRSLNGKVFDVGTGKPTTLSELFSILSKLTNYKESPKINPFQNGDILHSKANTKLIEEYLDFVPSIPLSEGLKPLTEHPYLTKYHFNSCDLEI